MAKTRCYHSALRARQAYETRWRIVEAAERLFVQKGYEGTTITAIAIEAGVAPQTVYAAFGSKKGIIAEILDRIRADSRYQTLQQRAMASRDPQEFLHTVSHIICDIFNSRGELIDSLRGTLTTSPELALFLREQRMNDRDRMRLSLEHLYDIAPIRKGLTFEQALDIYWTLLSFEPFLSLVKMRGWPLEEYENWLTDVLAQQLLAPLDAS